MNMNHFTFGEWADFARHLQDPVSTEHMQRHLDGGCQRCSQAVRMWQNLIDFGSRETLYSPPDRVLRTVKGYVQLLKPARRSAGVMAMLARLVFDSSREPLPAGIRSSRASARQLVYSAGDFLIDLRLERRPGGVSLVGQAQQRTGAKLTGIDVIALKGTRTVLQTKANRFGEFQLDLESGRNEEVSLVIKGAASIVIPLPDV
jgi:hypothetical protein